MSEPAAERQQLPIPPECVEAWQGVLADVLWWFRGFEAHASARQRRTLPDLDLVREMRADLTRLNEGLKPLSSIRQELPF